MRKMILKSRWLPFVFSAALLYVAPGQSLAHETDVPAARQGKAAATEQVHLLPTDQLVGKSVQGAQNENLGEISDFKVDAEAGQIRYMVLASEGEQYVVPWQAVDFQHPQGQFKLDITADRLKQAPKGAEVADRQQAERIFQFYGIAPYWEKEQGKSMQ